jgi:UDP-GlcNAc:undecaprenyl-phosphate GlcNAc-1-phosphate transferase
VNGVTAFLVFVTALVTALSVIPVILRLAQAYGIYDLPDHVQGGLAVPAAGVVSGPPVSNSGRRMHVAPIPRLGGGGIVLGVFLSICVWLTPNGLGSVLIPSVALYAMGLCDDVRSIGAKWKFLIQVSNCAGSVYASGLSLSSIVLTPDFQFHLSTTAGFILSTFVVVGAINAVNMIDGLDGLAGGLVLIGIAFLSYLLFLSTDDIQTLLFFSFPVIGALIGFLRYNTHPAKIFMGDGGSHWLGFMVGILILLAAGAFGIGPDGREGAGMVRLVQVTPSGKFGGGGGAVPLISAVMCLAIPVFDTASVMVRRVLRGESPMKADKAHLHHSLMEIGFSHPQAVLIMYFFAVCNGVIAVLPVAFPLKNLWWAPYLAAVILLVSLPLLLRVDRNFISRVDHNVRSMLVTNPVLAQGGYGTILRTWEAVNRYTIYGILMITPVFAGVPPREVGYAAAVAGGFLVLSFLLSSKQPEFVLSTVLSIAAGVILLSNNFNEIYVELAGQRYSVQGLYNATFVLLLISTCGLLLFSFRRRYLLVTPTDFLMLILPLTLLMVPDPYQSQFHLNTISLRAWVLFLSLRFMARRTSNFTEKVRLVMIASLLLISLISIGGLRVVY